MLSVVVEPVGRITCSKYRIAEQSPNRGHHPPRFSRGMFFDVDCFGRNIKEARLCCARCVINQSTKRLATSQVSRGNPYHHTQYSDGNLTDEYVAKLDERDRERFRQLEREALTSH